MDKPLRVFLVLGPESSGTRLATSILISAGCCGSAEHIQSYDTNPFPSDCSFPVVWRRSVPHGDNEQWIGDPISQRYIDSKIEGCITTAVVTVRDWNCMVRSQLRAPHVNTAHEAFSNIRRAYVEIFRFLSMRGIGYYMLVYEQLVQYPIMTQKRLLKSLELQHPGPYIQITNSNSKYCAEEPSGKEMILYG